MLLTLPLSELSRFLLKQNRPGSFSDYKGGYFFMCEMVGRPLTWAIYPFAAAIGAAWWDDLRVQCGAPRCCSPTPAPAARPPTRPPTRPKATSHPPTGHPLVHPHSLMWLLIADIFLCPGAGAWGCGRRRAVLLLGIFDFLQVRVDTAVAWRKLVARAQLEDQLGEGR